MRIHLQEGETATMYVKQEVLLLPEDPMIQRLELAWMNLIETPDPS